MSKYKEIIKHLVARSKDKGASESEQNKCKALVDKLMKKHSISMSEIEEEEVKSRVFNIKFGYNWKLFVQIKATVMGDKAPRAEKCRVKKYARVDCTASQQIEIQANFNFYLAEWEKMEDDFLTAFIAANDLYPSDGEVKQTHKMGNYIANSA